MSRRLFNEPDVARRLEADFVPAAGSVERLQPDRYGHAESVSSRWFGPMARKAMAESEWKHFFAGFGTLQGVYVCGPDGTPYDYTNVHFTDEDEYRKVRADFLKWMDRGLARYRERPPARVDLGAKDVARGAPAGAPSDAAVLRVFSRVRMPQADHPANRGVGRDHAWIFGEEVRELAATSSLPRAVVARLVRFHLFDNTRNIGMAFDAPDVKQADFSARVVRKEGDVLTVRFVGTFLAEREDREHAEKVGVAGRLEGEVDVDAAAPRVVRFRAYGEGTGWGDVKRTGAPEGKYPLAFAFVEAKDEVARAVPPFWHGASPVWEPIYRKPVK